jgi:hypothetical protein
MPLQDHFHPPLNLRRHWHAFHNSWATYLASDLNRRLPGNFFAEANVQFHVEIDVAAFQEGDNVSVGVRELPDADWIPPDPAMSIPFALLSPIVEIAIFGTAEGPVLAGAIELVSPANKDRPESRVAFLSKCQTYLQQGIGLVIVDVVTERLMNLHNELMTRLRATEGALLPDGLYAAAYRPVQVQDQDQLQIWKEPLALGQALPTLPLWLRNGPCLPVALEAAYERTRQEQRVPA